MSTMECCEYVCTSACFRLSGPVAPVHMSLRSLGLENRATMECCGNAAAFVLRIRLQRLLAFVCPGPVALVHMSLRSLGLENRATLGCCGNAAAFVLRIRLQRMPALVCRSLLYRSYVASLARFGKPSDYGGLRQRRSFRAANSLCNACLHAFVGICCTGSYVASLARFENRATMECCGNAAAFVLRIRLATHACTRLPGPVALVHMSLRSLGLETERLCGAAATPQLSCYEFVCNACLLSFAGACCTGSYVASLARFGKPSDYAVLRQRRSFRIK